MYQDGKTDKYLIIVCDTAWHLMANDPDVLNVVCAGAQLDSVHQEHLAKQTVAVD